MVQARQSHVPRSIRRDAGFITNAWPAIIVSGAIVAALLALLVVGPSGSTGSTAHRPLVVYCAAGMSEPVNAVIEDYRDEFGVDIQFEPAGSGTLLSKIRTTRPELRGDIYLAADPTYIDRAIELNLVDQTVPVTRIRPVIAVAPGNPNGVRSIDDLLDKDRRIVLANPEAASIGRVAKKLLDAAGKWKSIEARVSDGAGVSFVGTVNEVAVAVSTGAAQAGIVWDSVAKMTGLDIVDDPALAVGGQTVTIARVDPSAHADDAAAAMHFIRYLTARDRGLRRFAERGFDVVEHADTWADHPTLTLMAGAMLKPAIDEAITEFEKTEGVTINRIYNGCGILVAQMKTGTQPDAYFSCDVSFMTEVADRFDPSVTVSRNPMVMLVKPGNPRGLKSLADLAAGDDLAIGFAHPTNSALGALTDRLLRRSGLHDAIYARNRVVHGDAGHLVVNQMAVGSLDAAIVYQSNAKANPDNATAYDILPIEEPDAVATQPFAVARDAKHPQLTRRLFDAVTEAAPRDRFDRLGFEWLMREGAAP